VRPTVLALLGDRLFEAASQIAVVEATAEEEWRLPDHPEIAPEGWLSVATRARLVGEDLPVVELRDHRPHARR
jgi:hypothetical protein